MKKMPIITILSLVLFLVGCAGQRSMIKTKSIHIKPIDQKAVSLFIDGVIDDLNQNYASALLSYQEALLYDSTSATIYLDIAKDYIRLGKEESALLSLEKCLHFNHKSNEARELMATIYVNQGMWKKVEKLYQEILAYDSTRIDMLYNLALLYLRLDDKDKIIDTYQRILSSQRMPPARVFVGLGEVYIDMGKYDEAIQVFQRLVESYPEEAFGYYGIGLTKEAMKDTMGAIQGYQQALAIEPDFAQAREQLGDIYFSRGLWNEAQTLFSQAVAIDSSDLSSWLLLGEIYWEKGDSIAAFETHDSIKRRFPEDWRAYFNMGRIYLDTQQHDLAFKEFKKVIDLSEETHLGWLYAGIALVLQDSLKPSIPYFEKTISIVPENSLGNYYLGSVLDRLDQTNEAISYYQVAIHARPRWVSALNALAGAYEKLKMYTHSDSLFQHAIGLNPDNALLLNNYGYSLSERGTRLDEAMNMAQKALTQDPDNGAYLDTVGWIYYKMGEYDKALDYVKKAYEQRNDSAVVIEHLGDIYYRLLMKQDAKNSWEKALELNRDNLELKNKLDSLDTE